MGILGGALTVRRYRVLGEVPDDFRDRYQDALRKYAFRESAEPVANQERAGWVEVHNLLDVGFDDWNRWLYDRYLVWSLRVDKKVVPAKLLRAHLEKREQAWCVEHGRERCPSSVRKELKEQLEFEMVTQTLPRVQTTEVCWNLAQGWVLFHSLSEKPNEVFRKLFLQTFGLRLLPEVPLDLLGDDMEPERSFLLQTGGVDFSAGGAA